MTESHQSELLALNTEVDQLKQQLQASNSEVVCEQQMLPAEQLAAKGEEVQKLMDHMADFEDELRDLQLLLNEKDSKLDDLMEENSQLRTSLEDANRQVTAGAIELKVSLHDSVADKVCKPLFPTVGGREETVGV